MTVMLPPELAADLDAFRNYTHAERGLAVNTTLAYARHLERFAAWAAAGGVADYLHPEPRELAAYLAHLHEAGLAPASVAGALSAVKQLYRWLLREERIGRNPAARVRPPAQPEHLPQALPDRDVRKLLAAPRRGYRSGVRDRALLELLFASGARASEAAGLDLSDLRLDEGLCLCRHGKGGRQRMLRLGRKAVKALREYLAELRPVLTQARPDEAALFVTRGGRRLDRVLLWKLVKKYARRAGLSPRTTTHQLRHSFASSLVEGGADLRAVQELLGHASIRNTQRYVAVDRVRLRAVHEKYHPRGS